ncbi:MAG: DUF4189 domain-containing protein [Mycobacterium sp.]|nr:DUF4189 domain-containing protein [Mycobacterium sp.]
MASTRKIWAIVAAGVLAGGVMTGCAKSESPSSETKASETTASESKASETKAAGAEDISVAVGTGEFTDTAGDADPETNTIVGFTATAATNDEASAKVIKACEDAGGVECTADEVTNDNVCIASVASSETHVVAGGAGATVEDARLDAIKKSEDNKTPLGADAVVIISACP